MMRSLATAEPNQQVVEPTPPDSRSPAVGRDVDRRRARSAGSVGEEVHSHSGVDSSADA